jgi:hypothetical protein
MLQQIAKLGYEGVFTPEDIRILVAAFDAAWMSLISSGAPFSEEHHQAAAREILAKAIIRAAQNGESDERSLREVALLELSKANLRRPRPAPK